MFKWKGKELDHVTAQKITKNWTTYFILAMAVGAMTFFGVCDPTSSMLSGPTGVAAYVDNQKVSNMEFRRAYQAAYDQYQRQYKEAFDPALFQLSRSVIRQLVNERVTYELADSNGIFSTVEDVEKTLADAEVFKDEGGKFSSELLEQYLRANRYTEATLTEEIKRNLTENKFRRFVTDTYQISSKQTEWDYRLAESKVEVEFIKITPSEISLTITPAEIDDYIKANGKKIDDYYEKNKADFNTEKKVNAQHILVGFKEARNATGEAKNRTKEQAKQLAERVLADVKSGKPFEELVKTHSDDPSAKTNSGNLGFFNEKDMVPEFSKAAFALKAGGISSVVESPFGFHIIKVLEVREAKSTPIEEARKDIASKMIATEKKPKLLDDTAKLALAAIKDPAKNQTLAAQYNTKWEATGSFPLSSPSVPKLGNEPQIVAAVLSLTKEKPVYPELLTVGPDRVIVRLKNLDIANVAGLDEAKRQNIQRSQRFSESFGLINALTEESKKQFEKSGKIWINEEYEYWDENRAAQNAAANRS
jgi:peptidyl-prolyl cis-trans isomerase D